MTDKSFIEVQFPVSKVSKESYKERMANLGQTLTGLGKWWGRKPLIMVRAALLGLIMPAGNDPKKDMDTYLKILAMDKEGLWLRKNKSIPPARVFELVSARAKQEYLEKLPDGKVKYKAGVKQDKKKELQNIVFSEMSYDEKLKYCIRTEHLDDTKLNWKAINDHLSTDAKNLQELFQELGKKKFGDIPTVGDCFCGGGNIPFEAARMGLDVYACELNPVATLLTWAALNILGSSKEEIGKIKEFQQKVYDLVDKQITEWGIEHNEDGWRANSYLYCFETRCPECGYMVPLAPSWVIGKGTMTIAVLKQDDRNKRFDIEIKSGASKEQFKKAEEAGTVKNDKLHCPSSDCDNATPISVIRGDRRDADGNPVSGLRRWEAGDFIPRPDDVFQERLYCIRYTENYIDENGNEKAIRHYVTPDDNDLEREQKVVELLRERFKVWQEKGYLPSAKIEEGYNTSQVIRERGWSYWHQLFNPRQLLIHGLFLKEFSEKANTQKELVIGLLGINKCCDWNSKLCIWNIGIGTEKSQNTFSNQALNTLFNYGCRSLQHLSVNWFFSFNSNYTTRKELIVQVNDARTVSLKTDLWITDPPYADSVNYHELSEFFLAWDKELLAKAFPDWYTDSKRALAVKGTGYSFNNSMVEIYKNLNNHMPDNGMQIVMFTHQDVKVWAELALILWSANLRVTAAWNIATETESGGLKAGNYVKGTVLLVLRKQTSEETAFEDELFPEIEDEVKRQVDNMKNIDDKEDPNFADPDYLLAAYASSLKVLTSYKKIEGINVQYELSKERNSNEPSPVETLIRSAVKIAYDYLIPQNFDSFTWKLLTPAERFFIKGLEVEKHGNTQLGTYQELARGFGVGAYQEMLAGTKANQARLKTATEYAMKNMQSDDAKISVVRNALVAIHRGIKEEDPQNGRNWLRNELKDYWNKREQLVEILGYLSEMEYHDSMEQWREDARYARLIRELVRNDGY